MSKSEPFDYFTKRDALAEEFHILIERAGIAQDVARCEEILEPDFFADRDLPPLFTKAREEEQKRRDRDNYIAHCNCLRHVVFRVENEELRRHIIKKVREFRELKVRSFKEDVWQAERQVKEAEKDSGNQGIYMALGGVFLVVIGWKSFGTVGALAAGVFSIILAIYGVREMEQTKRRRVQQATAELADSQACLDNVLGNPEEFAIYEEDTGKPEEIP